LLWMLLSQLLRHTASCLLSQLASGAALLIVCR